MAVKNKTSLNLLSTFIVINLLGCAHRSTELALSIDKDDSIHSVQVGVVHDGKAKITTWPTDVDDQAYYQARFTRAIDFFFSDAGEVVINKAVVEKRHSSIARILLPTNNDEVVIITTGNEGLTFSPSGSSYRVVDRDVIIRLE